MTKSDGPGGTIPAYERKIVGGKLTLDGTPLPLPVYSIIFQNNFIGVGNIGNIKVNGAQYTLPTGSFSVTAGDTITATAMNQSFNNIDYSFSNWSNSSTTATTKFVPTANTTYTANFIGRANKISGLNFINQSMQPITVLWDKHPNANVTQYQIWRKVNYKKQGTGAPALLGTVDSSITSFVDNDFMGTRLGFTDWMLWYDVKSYYSIESTYSADAYASIFAGGLLMEIEKDKTEIVKTENVKENKIENYPNPFNPSTIIKYQIVKAGHVTLKIYDTLGREVANLVDREQASGQYSVSFNASKLASGIYFYRISANGFSKVKKMLLMK